VVTIFSAVVIAVAQKPSADQETSASWRSRLYTPTLLTQHDGRYFIVDCWHGRVLWSDSLDLPIAQWRTLDESLHGPHSIVGSGQYLFVEDTEAGAVRIYRKTPDSSYVSESVITNLGNRPHRLQIDEKRKQLVALAGNSQELFFIETRPPFAVKERVELPFLEHAYTRSFSIYGDEIFFVSGPGRITIADLTKRPLTEVRSYSVPKGFESMNDLFHSGTYWYLTATPQRILRVKYLEDLATFVPSGADTFYKALGLRGTPYYLQRIGDSIIIPEITEWSGFTSFREQGAEIRDSHQIFPIGEPDAVSVARKAIVMTRPAS
jgi:hypothetical protein